jgi:HSP20 family protein
MLALRPLETTGLLDRFFNEAAGRINFPSVDVAETDARYEIHVAAPGMKKDDFAVEFNKGVLTISGERKFEQNSEGESNGRKWHKVETSYGKFSRSFTLPENVKADGLEAEYQDGVLKIFAPKDGEKIKSRQISIR